MTDDTAPSVFARIAGRRAFERSEGLDANRYLPNSPSWHEWNAGYEAASIRRKSA